MNYTITLTLEEMQFIVDTLTKTPLPYEKVNPVINSLIKQATEQEAARKNPVTQIIEESKTDISASKLD